MPMAWFSMWRSFGKKRIQEPRQFVFCLWVPIQLPPSNNSLRNINWVSWSRASLWYFEKFSSSFDLLLPYAHAFVILAFIVFLSVVVVDLQWWLSRMAVFLIMTMENHLLRHVYVKKEKILDYFSSEILFFFSNEVEWMLWRVKESVSVVTIH